MLDGVEIKGGAGEFEAAVIAIVLDNLAHEDAAVRQSAPTTSNELPAWVRAGSQLQPTLPTPGITPAVR